MLLSSVPPPRTAQQTCRTCNASCSSTIIVGQHSRSSSIGIFVDCLWPFDRAIVVPSPRSEKPCTFICASTMHNAKGDRSHRAANSTASLYLQYTCGRQSAHNREVVRVAHSTLTAVVRSARQSTHRTAQQPTLPETYTYWYGGRSTLLVLARNSAKTLSRVPSAFRLPMAARTAPITSRCSSA